MADYGLKVYDSLGNITLSATDSIARLRYSTEVSAGTSGSITLSDIDGFLTAQFGLAISENTTGHKVTRSGTTISWASRGTAPKPSGDTLVVVFLYN